MISHRDAEFKESNLKPGKEFGALHAPVAFSVSHANRILKRFIAIARKKIIIPASINVSFQITSKPTPFIITDFTML